eukprot:CAMPEP_0194435656 /NCGR_PEP_ID=MMETSP0176-20130528/90028_1 /TAXON_ID=216777 /ORGANISM="Proboscia alata, Strain PI-D3" /LENGTH=70 /DNA_ID=CAMNT_0039255169 /DNA_START=327 /DNA_END=539 /DNA_ORIENTATION=+
MALGMKTWDGDGDRGPNTHRCAGGCHEGPMIGNDTPAQGMEKVMGTRTGDQILRGGRRAMNQVKPKTSEK